MGTRGRTSGSELATLQTGAVQAIQRPDAPYDLTDEQAEEWRAIVNRLPAEWFPRETWPLLTQYCRHIVAARRIAQLIADCEKGQNFEEGRWRDLLKAQELEGRAMSSLATRMRLTQQTTYDKTKKKPVRGDLPWES